MRTPSCDSTAAVARVSSPSRKPRMRESPSAMAASISARCETDLSPGTCTLPCKGWPGWLIQSRRFNRIPSKCDQSSSGQRHRIGAQNPYGRRRLANLFYGSLQRRIVNMAGDIDEERVLPLAGVRGPRFDAVQTDAMLGERAQHIV